MSKAVVDFLKAKNKAFEDKGTKFGEVEFTCPICSGEAWAIREYTPDNMAHSTTTRASCDGCGTFLMN